MIIDKFEKRVIIMTGVLLSFFIFSMLYARSKYNDLPECLPFDKAYTEPKVVELDEKTYQVFAVASMWQFLLGLLPGFRDVGLPAVRRMR